MAVLEKLFSSRLRYKIIAYFLKNPAKEIYPGYLSRAIREDGGNVSRELKRLAALGLLKGVERYNKTIYLLDEKNKFASPLSALFKMESQRGQGEWLIFEEVSNNTNPTLTYGYMNSAYFEPFLKEIGVKTTPGESLSIFSRGGYKICFPAENYKSTIREVLELIANAPGRVLKLSEELVRKSDIFFGFAKKVRKTNLNKLSDDALVALLEDFYRYQAEMHVIGWVGNVADFVDGAFSRYLLKYLDRQIELTGSKVQKGEAFSVLTTPLEEGFAQKEYRSYLKIVSAIRRNKEVLKLFEEKDIRLILDELSPRFRELFDKQAEEFGWIGYGVEGPGWDREYYVDLVASLIRQGVNPAKLEQRARAEREEAFQKQKELVKVLRVDGHWQKVFEVARGFVFTKGYRKDALFHGLWCLEFLHREFARRTNLTLRQARYIHPWEYGEIMAEKEKWSSELSRRWEYCVYYSERGKQKVLGGEEARKFSENFRFEDRKVRPVKKLEGDCASPGKVRGVVTIINTPEENGKIEKADILVSAMTNPDLMPAIRKAKAIVTDMGGLTCHAAIVSREFGIPCVVGTRIATQILKDGSVVEVDATHGVVTLIKK